MNKIVVFTLLALFCLPSFSEEKKQTKDQCIAKCLPLSAEFPDHQRHEAALLKIKKKRSGVTDQAILEELDKEEQEEMEKYLDKHERTCRSMCRFFPETL